MRLRRKDAVTLAKGATSSIKERFNPWISDQNGI